MSAAIEAAEARPLTVHADGDIFSRQSHGGVRRSTECLLAALLKRPDVSLSVQLSEQPIGAIPPELSPVTVPARRPRHLRPSRLFLGVNRRASERSLRRSWAQRTNGVFLSTYYTTYDSLRIPQVSVVHDMIFELFPGATRGAFQERHKLDKRRSIDAADLIICPSQSALNDLSEFANLDGKRTTVIPWGVEPWFAPVDDAETLTRFRHKATGGAPYLLYVGGRSGTKNFIALAIAYSRWQHRGAIRLLSVGGGPFTNEEHCLLLTLGIEHDVDCCPSLDNEALVVAYAAATGCVMPSLYEGFGFPVAEALACGTPVACSSVSSLPEVGGRAAVYFDPCDQDGMLHALDRLLAVDRHGEAMRADQARLRSRDWSVVASDYLDCMRGIACEPHGAA